MNKDKPQNAQSLSETTPEQEDELSPEEIEFSPEELEQQRQTIEWITSLQEKLSSLQEALDERTDKAKQLQQLVDEERARWKSEHDLTPQPVGADTLRGYQEQVFAPKVRIDTSETKGRILRATSAMETAEVVLAEKALVYITEEQDWEIADKMDYPAILKAMARLEGNERALLLELSNAHEDQVENDTRLIETLHLGGLFTEPKRSAEEIARYIGICNTNIFESKARTDEEVDGVGLFPFAAMLSHDCQPNCTFAVEDKVVYIQASRPIEAGEEVTISYIDPYQPLHPRQEVLKKRYNFICTCALCSQENS